MLSVCDHYLSYTELSTQNLVVNGFERARITPSITLSSRSLVLRRRRQHNEYRFKFFSWHRLSKTKNRLRR